MIAREYGVISRNYGIGGTRIATQTIPSEYPRHDLDFVRRVDEMDLDSDVIIVFGGTNDFSQGDAPLGSFTDRTCYSFYGTMHVLCNKLINRYPESTIIFITPLHRFGDEQIKSENGGKVLRTLKQYVDAIR